MAEIDTIRDRIDIVELIGETVQLRRAGRILKGLCPFHTERTPSFIVNPERRTWHCFGACGTGGDIFSFLMRRENLTFGEALRTLAVRAGVEISGHNRQKEAENSRLLEANERAAAFFHNALLNSAEAAQARDYAERRGLDADTMRLFEIGYAPDAWEALGSYLASREFSTDEIEAAGLSVRGERGVHDRFRKRLMFPIRDERGRAVGFGGRALDDSQPKYLNSPQTAVFDKGSLLYALNHAADAIRRTDRAVIVEGYLDAITAHQYGFANVVASLGTALTDRQIDLIKRYSRKVALALDADAAGLEAMMRGEQLVRSMEDAERPEVVVEWGSLVRLQSRAPVDLRIFNVPAGKDPDEAIRADPSGWPAWVESALPPFDFRLRYELSRIDRSNARERLQVLDRLLPLLAEIGDRTLQAQSLSDLATAIGVRENEVRLRLNTLTPSSKRGQPLRLRERADAAVAAARRTNPGMRTEQFCLALLLRFPELRATGLALNAETFDDTSNRLIFELWREHGSLDEEVVPEEFRDHWLLLESTRMVTAVTADPHVTLDDCLKRIALHRLEGQKRVMTAAIVEQQAEIDRQLSAAARDTGTVEPEAGDGRDAGSITAQVLADIQLGRRLHLLEHELRTGQQAADFDSPAPAPNE